MATRAEIYRSRAAECEVAASAATEAKTRQTYEDLAKQWHSLARQIEALERRERDL